MTKLRAYVPRRMGTGQSSEMRQYGLIVGLNKGRAFLDIVECIYKGKEYASNYSSPNSIYTNLGLYKG